MECSAKLQSSWTYTTPNAPFNDCFDKVMNAFIHKFAGPADTGVPSPSAQETGYNMCMSAVEDCAPHLLDISIETPNLHYMPLSSHSVPEHSESFLPSDPFATLLSQLLRPHQNARSQNARALKMRALKMHSLKMHALESHKGSPLLLDPPPPPLPLPLPSSSTRPHSPAYLRFADQTLVSVSAVHAKNNDVFFPISGPSGFISCTVSRRSKI